MYTHRAYTHNSVWTLLWLHKFIRNISWKKPSQRGLDPAVYIRTVPIRTAVLEPCCVHIICFEKDHKRSRHSGVQILLCVYAPCLYAQQCLTPAVIAQIISKYFVKEGITAGSRPCCVYTLRAYTHSGVGTLSCLRKLFRKGLYKKLPQRGPEASVCQRTVPTRTAAPCPRSENHLVSQHSFRKQMSRETKPYVVNQRFFRKC